MSGPVSIQTENEIGVIVVDNPPVNALSAAVRQGLAECLSTLEADDAIKAIVLHCAGRTFFAGADITEFDKPFAKPGLPEVVDRIEACAKPVIAALHGTVLGGGCEVALGCHTRIAVPGTRLGLPEVKLGLLPGAGGTQRLPRLVGTVRAFEIISSGNPITAQDAADIGLVDQLVDGDLLDEAISIARRIGREGAELRRLSQIAGPWPDGAEERAKLAKAAEPVLKKRRGFPAIEAIAESVGNAIDMPFGDAAARERELFMALKDGYQSAAQRYLFFAERAAMKIDDMPVETAARKIEKAAVLGAGTMGGGISMCFANAGIPVVMIDPNKDAIDARLSAIRGDYQKTAKRRGEGESWVETRMGAISASDKLDEAANADMVVEAVFEDMALKKRIFADLDRICRPETVLATNTSTLDIDEIAAATKRPGAVVGMHFFSPANVMRLLEVVRGKSTDFVTLKTAIETGRRLSKLPVTVGVCYGFVGNRMLHARGSQVEKLLLEGASPQQLDTALTDFGFAMGPCAVGDLAGLDVGWRIRKEAGRTAAIADALCEAGRFGQKTGKGYYRYEPGNRNPLPDPEVDAMIEAIAAAQAIERRPIDASEIFERLVFPLINEGARILEEGIARSASDIDLIWVNGYGWPAFEGGPMFLANRLGLKKIVERLEHYAAATGVEALLPASLLVQLAGDEGKFT